MDFKKVLIELSQDVKSGKKTYEEAEQELAKRVTFAAVHHGPKRKKAPGVPLSLFSVIQGLRRQPVSVDLEPLKAKMKAARREFLRTASKSTST